MTAHENKPTGIGGRHRNNAGAAAGAEHLAWQRTEFGWIRQSDLSLAAVTDGHAWSVTSVRCGTASGQAPSHIDAMNTARAVLQVWQEIPDDVGAVDNDHHDDPWGRSVASTAAATPGAVDGV